MKGTKVFTGILCLVLLGTVFSGAGMAQTAESIYSFSADSAVVSKYIWRGQRLTNDWSLQPSMTLSIGGFSFNAWGTLDMRAVNEGDSLPIRENPLATANASGLKGKFSEIDYTFSFARSYSGVSVDVGTIFYTFPERGASLPSTTELYGGVTFDNVPLAPSATLYVDVDETRAAGKAGTYFLLGAGHSFGFNHPVFTGLDVSGSLSFVNSGFRHFYYGAEEATAGTHDANFTVALPIAFGNSWSASPFLTYSALLRDMRQHQFQDPRRLYTGTAGSPGTYADTVWGGFNVNLTF